MGSRDDNATRVGDQIHETPGERSIVDFVANDSSSALQNIVTVSARFPPPRGDPGEHGARYVLFFR